MTMRRSSRGFSLIEVTVAIAITAVMGGMIAVSFNTSIKAKEEIEAEAEHYRMLRSAMNRMTREIGAAYVSDRYDPRLYRDQDARPTNFVGERDRLLFSSMAHQRLFTDAKESDQMVVEYQLKTSTERDAKGRQDLVRREDPIVQDRMDRDGTEETLLENVKKIEFEYWNSERKEWDDEWSTKRTERKSILPTRVKIVVTLLEDGKEVKYTTQTRVMLNTELPRFGQ
jgi:general secretion pathway protein J